MKLGKVIGSVVATRKDDRLIGRKLMVVCPLTVDEEGNLKRIHEKTCEIAVDLVGAGSGETVIFASGSSARYACSPDANSPVDLAIVGIVDQTDIDRQEID